MRRAFEDRTYGFWLKAVCILLFAVCAKSSSNSDLEAIIARSYTDKGNVRDETMSLDGGNARPLRIHYLASGPDPATAHKIVVFCHGAAFTSYTWKVVGVLDELGEQGYASVALDLPGFGKSEALRTKRLATSDQREVDRDTFLGAFLKGLRVNERSSQVVVVSASMGGTFAMPFIMDPGPYKVVGYVTVAGSIATSTSKGSPASTAHQGGKAAWFSTPHKIPPALIIFGAEDQRLSTDRSRYESLFPRSTVVVFENAPHPAYLRDRSAAMLFNDLVLSFVGAHRSTYQQVKTVPYLSNSIARLAVGVDVEATYRSTNKYYRAKITKVNVDGTYDLLYDDGNAPLKQGQNNVQNRVWNAQGTNRLGFNSRHRNTESHVPASKIRSLEYNGATTLSDKSEILPSLSYKAVWSH